MLFPKAWSQLVYVEGGMNRYSLENVDKVSCRVDVVESTGPDEAIQDRPFTSTVRDVVDDEGDVIRPFKFDEYGNMLNSSGTGATSPKTWIGGLSVNDDRADSGLWNMGHRNYAGGVLGRFISRDPIGHAGNLNLYAYPTNPVSFVDPSGLDVSFDGSQTDVARFNRLVDRYGLNDILSGIKAFQGDTKFKFVSDKETTFGSAYGTTSNGSKKPNLWHGIDLDDIVNFEREVSRCTGSKDVGRRLAGSALAHELVEGFVERIFLQGNPFISDYRGLFLNETHPRALYAEDTYLAKGGIAPRSDKGQYGNFFTIKRSEDKQPVSVTRCDIGPLSKEGYQEYLNALYKRIKFP